MLKTATQKGHKVMASTIAQEFEITMAELKVFANEIKLKPKNNQHLFSPEEANRLSEHIKWGSQGLIFNDQEWSNRSNLDDFQNLVQFIKQALAKIDLQIEQHATNCSLC